VIINPHALPLFRDDNYPGGGRGGGRGGKRKLERLRADPVATRQPERPLTGPGRGGRVGAASSLAQHVKAAAVAAGEEERSLDPRDAILRHAEAAKAKPFWVDPAYRRTQPRPVMAAAVFENDEEEQAAAKRQRPK
ncbi:WD repeat-containing protein 70, partial [Cladochytrium tenue]